MASHVKPYMIITVSLLLLISLTTSQTVYDILKEHGLPSGLLPDCVNSYTLDQDGNFEVLLNKPCYINFDYLVYYDKRITGTLKYGSITHLKGIQVRRFFVWLGVDQITVDLPPTDSIYFQVGIINKKLGLDQFQSVHSCRDNQLGLRSLKLLFQLPPPVDDEIQMLLTE